MRNIDGYMSSSKRHIDPIKSISGICNALGYALYIDIALGSLLIFETLEILVYSATPFCLIIHIVNDALNTVIVLIFLFGRKTSFLDEPFKGRNKLWKKQLILFVLFGVGTRCCILPTSNGLGFSILFGATFYSVSICFLLFQWKSLKIWNDFALIGESNPTKTT